MRDGQAVLARNVMDDSQLGSRDSKGDILATSVICAPVRSEGKVLGLIHLYSTDSARPTDPDDLEFTLAVADTVAVALDNLAKQQALAENLNSIRDENVQLRERLGVQSEIIGTSDPMRQVEQDIARAAPSRATVLIRGESGVGKELVARAVHYSSPRRKGPFVCLNCAALSETLLESELFGHEKGAFTGATERKIGKFEQADKGTLMLDEIGEMNERLQAKFLRVLEGHPFERVGGADAIKVDVRVIAATNRDLEKDVAEANSAATSIFASTCWRSSSPRSASGPRTSPCSPNTSSAASSPRPATRSKASRRGRWKNSCATAGQATSAK
jgi:Nif-specific regulatory protein